MSNIGWNNLKQTINTLLGGVDPVVDAKPDYLSIFSMDEKKEELKDKDLIVLYINVGAISKDRIDKLVGEVRKSLISLKYKYDVIVLPVWDQDTNVELFTDKRDIEMHKIKLEGDLPDGDLTDLEKIEKLVKI